MLAPAGRLAPPSPPLPTTPPTPPTALQHHAAPNELDAASKHALDPDIDTLPLLAWSAEQLQGSAVPRPLVRVQQYTFFPILLFARLAWAQQSVEYVVDLVKARGPGAAVEAAALTLHYGWYVGAAFTTLPPLAALAYCVMAQLFCGLLLALVFVQSHNGMEVYSSQKDFVTAQVVSTRDIAPGPWADWFSGGLNYQVEHHIFPTLPRHNLGAVAPAVKALCEKHGLQYESVSFALGTRRVLARLADVAKLA